MIEIKNVTKYFGSIPALNDVILSIKPGETYALLGKNGAGKTTLFRIIMGLVIPDIGKVLWNNHPIKISDLLKVGYVPEVRSLMPQLKVKQQVQYFSSIKGVNKTEFLKRWDLYADILDLKKYEKTKIKNLSKGNQQKVQLVCGIMHNPDLIILDEPFSGLDVINRDLIGKVINLLKESNKIIIFSSHLIEDVEKFCESIIMIDNGSVVYQGSINQIKEDFKKYTILEVLFRDMSFEQVNKIAEILRNGYQGIDIKISANKLQIKTTTVKQQDEIKAFLYKSFLQYIIGLNVILPSLNDIFIERVGFVDSQKLSIEKLSTLKSDYQKPENIHINFNENNSSNSSSQSQNHNNSKENEKQSYIDSIFDQSLKSQPESITKKTKSLRKKTTTLTTGKEFKTKQKTKKAL